MIRQTFHFEIITPCFCAGADQSHAEIRAPSIRGQLRWWFRVLGGNPTDERAVFGSVAGGECSASLLQVRVAGFHSGPVWNPPQFSPNDSESYVWHFARESGKPAGAGRLSTGPRWQTHGVVSPGSTFEMHLLRKHPLPARFDLALNAFLMLGTLGLRATRGLGAFHCLEAPPLEDIIPSVEQTGFTIKRRSHSGAFPDYTAALKDYSAWLRHDLRKERKAEQASPLGGISPRQASAVHFRPFKISPQQFSWLAYEAPHQRVLGENSRTTQPMLKSRNFVGPTPQGQQRSPRR